MTISIWGWGSCGGVITTWGWGEAPCEGFVPTIIAKFLSDSYAYTCVLKREYVEIQSRARGTVLLRIKPSQIPERLRGEVLQRIATDVSVRSPGWPFESGEICD